MGAAIGFPELNSDATYNKVAGEQYNLGTAENACKWAATEPAKNVYNFTQCDFVYDYAKRHNMTFRVANLCWGV